MNIGELVKKQREYFNSGKTKPVDFRLEMLKELKEEVKRQEGRIHEALKRDLNKSEFESYMTETGLVLSEIGYLEKHLRSYARPKRHLTPLAAFSSRPPSTTATYSGGNTASTSSLITAETRGA